MYYFVNDVEKRLQQAAESIPHVRTKKISFVQKGEDVYDGKHKAPALSASASAWRIYLAVSPEKGSYIQIEIWLPEKCNGIFLGKGNGGMAGSLSPNTLDDAARQGYAAAFTDMGTAMGKASGIHHPPVYRDFGHRATHLMTVYGKLMAEAAYGEKLPLSIFYGGSTGGAQALAEAQRYPEDYDGILCGAPANNRIQLHTYFLWNCVHCKDKEGLPLFTQEICEQLPALAVEYAQSRGDGQPGDRFLSMSYNDKESVDQFVTLVQQRLQLTEEQAEGLRAVYYGPINPKNGKRIYNGLPMGSEMYGCGLWDYTKEREIFDFPIVWTHGAGYCSREFQFAEDFEAVREYLSKDMDNNDPDLSPFFNRGGKLLMASGTADPCVPFQDALGYVKRVNAIVGEETTAEHLKFYLVPSMDHRIAGCAPEDINAPDGRTMLELLIAWCTKGEIPGKVIGHLKGYKQETAVDRELYPIVWKHPEVDSLYFPPSADETYLK